MRLTPKVQEILSWYESDNPGVKANLARILMQGKLGGTGRMVILPVFAGDGVAVAADADGDLTHCLLILSERRAKPRNRLVQPVGDGGNSRAGHAFASDRFRPRPFGGIRQAFHGGFKPRQGATRRIAPGIDPRT